MKNALIICLLLLSGISIGQNQTERVPSYFGLQVRPVFPSRFIGQSELTLDKDGFKSTINQKLGYSFGATVRAGITKLIAFETGLNYTLRNFDVTTTYADSALASKGSLSFVEYDMPLNALVYIQLADEIFMNTSLGLAATFRPSDIGQSVYPKGKHAFAYAGIVENKIGLDFNANVGFEYRTRKKGFFYLGGSTKIAFVPLFQYVAEYSYDANRITDSAPFSGSFMSIDFKYFFPNIRNNGTQPKKGPIE